MSIVGVEFVSRSNPEIGTQFGAVLPFLRTVKTIMCPDECDVHHLICVLAEEPSLPAIVAAV